MYLFKVSKFAPSDTSQIVTEHSKVYLYAPNSMDYKDLISLTIIYLRALILSWLQHSHENVPMSP